ncbi:hypothetical protein [Nioella aestuarii]|uniref:hypothetical protein n=1 Tax=Nioella aestuarii TaxID=1662864 RepID=UPI003D7FC643
MKTSKLLNAASIVALSTLVGIRGIPAQTIIAISTQGPDEAAVPMCEPDQLGLVDRETIISAEGEEPGALATALFTVQADGTKFGPTLAFMLDRYRSERELVVTTFAAVFPQNTLAVTAAAVGCECSGDGNDRLEEIAALLNAIVEAVPGSFSSVLQYAAGVCPAELAGLLIAPPTATIAPTQVVTVDNEDPPDYG